VGRLAKGSSSNLFQKSLTSVSHKPFLNKNEEKYVRFRRKLFDNYLVHVGRLLTSKRETP
jgi:hypothetical protein